MGVAAGGVVPEPAGGGTGTAPGTRPRGSRACVHPARARRMDRRPRPRLRPLSELLREIEEREEDGPMRVPAGHGGSVDVGGPAWDAALEAAAAQVGPLAVGLLTAVAEVLDGRRPLAHLARLCPPQLAERVQDGLARVGPEFPRGARVRGLRLCPIVGAARADGAPGLAVEVAAALCGQEADGRSTEPRRTGSGRVVHGRARAAVARFELDATQAWRITELAVL